MGKLHPKDCERIQKIFDQKIEEHVLAGRRLTPIRLHLTLDEILNANTAEDEKGETNE